MIKIRTLFLTGFICCILQTQALAGIMNYAGYSHDDSTNIITGDGLEWMRWDVTVDQSINIALNKYSTDGWRLASNTEMTSLFNNFMFTYTFPDKENAFLSFKRAYTASKNDSHDRFVEMFGHTLSATWPITDPETPSKSTYALYGNDADADGKFKVASIRNDYKQSNGIERDAAHILTDDQFSLDYSKAHIGVALVRATNVPEPETLVLLGLGLVGLSFSRQQQRKKS
jgi:hypothetical protein